MSHPAKILIHNLSYSLPSGRVIFFNLNASFSAEKIGLVGRNGTGKSTLLQLILDEISCNSGTIDVGGKIAYVPQNQIFSPIVTIADLFECQDKLVALKRIENGSIDENDFSLINEDWNFAERITDQLKAFGMINVTLEHSLTNLSGGELTRVMLAKAFTANADFLLLDEPTNHLDFGARQHLYEFITRWHRGLLVVSHDRDLLNLMDKIVEIEQANLVCYGGNYESYVAQKATAKAALELHLHDAKKLLQKSKQSIQATYEKHEQKQSYGRKLRKSGSIDKLTANSKKGRSERSQSKMLIKEERLLKQAETQLNVIRQKIVISEEIIVALPATKVAEGKMILTAEKLSFVYQESSKAIIDNFNFALYGPQRIAIVGDNGTGKTTLIQLLTGKLKPLNGAINFGTNHISYLDQNSNYLNPELTVLENFKRFNPEVNGEDAYRSLAMFLFKNTSADKYVKDLSGGERLRALLACILFSKLPPQLLILDEPTNHLDLPSITSIESALKNYQGAMLIVSHDQQFLRNIGVTREIKAPFHG